MHRTGLGLLVIAVSALASRSAAAQDSAAAEVLFEKGLAEMKAQDYEKACPTLAESHRLDPLPGVLFTLASCERKRGRVATAMARYEDFLQLVDTLPQSQRGQQKARLKVAKKEKGELAKIVPKLTIIVPESAPAGTVVKRNDGLVGSPAYGVALPVDPGEHVITIQTPGGPVITDRVVVTEGEQKSIKLAVVLKPAEPPPVEPQPVLDPAVAPVTDGDAGEGSGIHPAWAGISVGLGVLGVGIGATTGVLALQKKSVVDESCTGSVCLTEEGKKAGDAGRTFGTVSTITLAAGSALLVTGLVLVLVGGKRRDPAVAAAASAWAPRVVAGEGTGWAGLARAW